MIQIIDETGAAPLNGLQSLADTIASSLELRGDVTIRFSTEGESRELNKRYRGIDAPTDVLSFPIQEEFPEGFYCGDILICLPLAQEQAMEACHSLLLEVQILILHGLLHLAGYDHETDNGQMEQLQRELIASLLPVTDHT